MKEKKQNGIHERGAKPGLSNRRNQVRLVEFVGVLALALALSSVGLGAGAASAPDLERSNEASARRWVRLGEAYKAARAEAAAVTMTNRFTALAVYYGVDPATLAANFDADTLRWFRLGEAYDVARAEAAATAMTDRYTALAKYCDGKAVTTRNFVCSADAGQLEP